MFANERADKQEEPYLNANEFILIVVDIFCLHKKALSGTQRSSRFSSNCLCLTLSRDLTGKQTDQHAHSSYDCNSLISPQSIGHFNDSHYVKNKHFR